MGWGPALTPARPARGSGDLPLDRDPPHIEAMFGHIAGRYDLMNRLMSAGMDSGWRRSAAAEARLLPGDEVLDVCCGTGDLTFTLAGKCPACDVVGLDFTPEMLARARQKAKARAAKGHAVPREFVQGDLLALPFEDRRFAAVTVGWGVRNVPDVPRAFREMARVTRPGGRVVCLESTRVPDGACGRFHAVWQGHVVPLMGRVVTGDPSAYSYLPASVAAFPRADELAAIMADAGLQDVRYRRFGFGAVALHVGEVPR